MTTRACGARSPRSHYDAIPIVTSFATELLATPTVADERTLQLGQDSEKADTYRQMHGKVGTYVILKV